MKYPFTKPCFRLKFSGLAANFKHISNKTNCILATPVSSQQNEKHPNEDQQRLPQTLGCGLGKFVRRYNDCKYLHRYLNVRIRRRRKKFHLKTLVK